MANIEIARLLNDKDYKPAHSDLKLLAKELQEEALGTNQLVGEELRLFNALNGIEMCWCGAAIHSQGRCFTHLNS